MNDDAPHSSGSSGSRHALFAGGGSGGHVFPGLAVGEELVARGWRVSWAGRGDGMEARLMAGRGVDFHPLAARAVVGRGPLGRARAAATLAASAWRARRLVAEIGADLVIGTGGYASAPAAVGARLGRRPVLLVEPNARAGLANRWLGRWAQGAAVASTEAEADFRCPVRITGVPVRGEFFERAGDPLPTRPRLLVVGGSQGARQINELLPAAVERLAPELPELSVLHQVGAAWVESARTAWAARRLGSIEVEVVAFLDDMAAAMAGASVVVSRAGAVTLAEIAAAGRPSVLVPLEIAGGHQRANARSLEAAGAAVVAAGDEATPERLATELAALLGDRQRLEAMAAAAARRSRPDAARVIADLAAELVEGAGR